ncbi:hypothetical protein HNY73_016455 [Argiope bruennichi]|uniref:EF-hand domain-containing protein n=1 Tax=Argiope bruennichi TaxID=94029 RepID=A0A8T0EK73_ARGBR|nr:hypothetical protein HNY73_016455 [Argiope bruennichi]
MSAVQNTADTPGKNNAKEKTASETKEDSGSSDDENKSSTSSKKKDPLDVSRQEAASGGEKKNSESNMDYRDETKKKYKGPTDNKQKDAESEDEKNDSPAVAKGKDDAAKKEDVSSEKEVSPINKEKVDSVLHEKESPTGPKDLHYLFQKYSDEEESTKDSEKITLQLFKKWLIQASLLDKGDDITEEYITELFEKYASEKDIIDFEEFQELLYGMAEETKQSYSEVEHKILTAGKPHSEINEDEDLHKAIEDSMGKICASSSEERQSKESESSDSSNKEKNENL